MPYLMVGFPLVLVTLTFSLARNLPASDIHTLSSTPAPNICSLNQPDRGQGCLMRRALCLSSSAISSKLPRTKAGGSPKTTRDKDKECRHNMRLQCWSDPPYWADAKER